MEKLKERNVMLWLYYDIETEEIIIQRTRYWEYWKQEIKKVVLSRKDLVESFKKYWGDFYVFFWYCLEYAIWENIRKLLNAFKEEVFVYALYREDEKLLADKNIKDD